MLDRTRSHTPKLSGFRTATFSALALVVAVAGTRIPTLLASPLAESSPTDIGPVVMTAPDGSSTSFQEDGTDMRKESAFPAGSIVFKHEGKSYIIRDRSTIEAANKLMAPMQELSRKQEELGAKQEKLGEQQSALGGRMEIIGDVPFDEATRQMLQKQLREVEEQLRSAQTQKAMESVREAQSHLGNLQAQLGDLQMKLSQNAGAMGEEQRKLGDQMGHLGSEMGALGAEQGKLGAKQAEASKRMERELKQLIERAQKQGLAQPLH